MWRAAATTLLAGLILAAAAPARADDSQDDVRCLIVALKGMQSAQPEVRNAGRNAYLYFQGRIDGREPGLDLKGALSREAAVMTAETFAGEVKRCGGILTQRGAELGGMEEQMRSGLRPTPSD
jgi:hypothetical protein